MPKFNANIQSKLSLKEILKINNNKMKKIKVPLHNTPKYYFLGCM
jgi:hypothetical protein